VARQCPWCAKGDSAVILPPADLSKPPSNRGFMSPYLARSTSVLALVTLLLAALLLALRGLNLAVDFTGGMLMEVHYPEALTAKAVQDTLVRAGLADASVKNAVVSYFFIMFPPRDDVLSPQSAPHVVEKVIASLSTERRHVEVTRVEIITSRVGWE